MTAEDRFWAKVSVGGECWEWIGARNPQGYGQIGVDGENICAHRFSWELLRGPIPAGLTIDHLCRHPWCVNPDHMEPVTNRENVIRGIGVTAANARKTHCCKGHEFSTENTYRRTDGYRECLTCKRALSKAWKAKRFSLGQPSA